MSGKLYLIPTTLGEDSLHAIPKYVIDRIHHLDTFIVERAKTARRFIKTTNPPYAISSVTIFELDKHQPGKDVDQFLEVLLTGKDIGLMSEAGCPGVADPGALVVQKAHRLGAEVDPLVGPSSLLLALMASGMNGQSFSFHGYLPIKKPELVKMLKRLETQALRFGETQLFIEAPYRNQNLLEQLLNHLHPDTLLGIATDLNLPSQFIKSVSVKTWKALKIPNLHKRPSVFLIGKGSNPSRLSG